MTTTAPTVQEWRQGKTDELPDGPWKAEPDKVQWINPTTDLDCLIVRGPSGALCGYVGVPPQHPWHGQGYSECRTADCGEVWCSEHSPECRVAVHGGLTYSRGCDEENPEGICHIPAPGRPADVWWFGFDCSHAWDISPERLQYGFSLHGDETYRDIVYVKGEVASLAEQIAAVSA